MYIKNFTFLNKAAGFTLLYRYNTMSSTCFGIVVLAVPEDGRLNLCVLGHIKTEPNQDQ